jgi:hypothetical protein
MTKSKRKAEGGADALRGPGFVPLISTKAAALRVAFGVVLIPGEPDADGDVVTAEQIESAAHAFLEKYRNVDVSHTLRTVAVPVESYIAPADLSFEFQGEKRDVPRGAWVLGVRVSDDSVWADIQSGKLSGLSIMAVSTKSAEVVPARVTLADLGEFFVPFVSIVERPAVPRAVWIALKTCAGGIMRRVFDVVTTKKGGTMNKDEIAALFAEMLKPVTEQIAALAAAVAVLTDAAAADKAKADADAAAIADKEKADAAAAAAAEAEAATKAADAAAAAAEVAALKAAVKSIQDSISGATKSVAAGFHLAPADGGNKGFGNRDEFGRPVAG